MHTLIVILAGIVLGVVLMLIAKQSKAKPQNAFYAFAALWFVLAAANMWYGVLEAGIPLTSELPIFVGVFLVPVAIIWFARSALGYRAV